MKNKIFILAILLCSNTTLNSESIEIPTIIENCKSCHSENYEGNKYIKSLKELKKINLLLGCINIKNQTKIQLW